MTDQAHTYTETVKRYRIVRHEELPPEHKASYRLRGINPDDLWSLIWSFDTLEAAELTLAACNAKKASFQTFKLVDGGKTETFERVAYF